MDKLERGLFALGVTVVVVPIYLLLLNKGVISREQIHRYRWPLRLIGVILLAAVYFGFKSLV